MAPHPEWVLVQLNVPSEEGEGDYFHRAFAPGQALSEIANVAVINLTNEHRHKAALLEAADVLVINMVCDPDLLPIVKRRRRAGLPTLFELNDDVFDLPPANPRRGFWEALLNRQVMEALLKSVDALQFSSHALRKKYGSFKDRSAVFPNQVLHMPPEPKWRNHLPVIVGWGGSLGHYDDLRRVAGPLSRWIGSREDVRLHLMCAAPVAELFRDLPYDRKRIFEPGSMQAYEHFLGTLDIGIGPLNPGSFNAARSDVKFLEYAAHGVVPVLQRAQPYRDTVEEGATGLLFDTAEELLKHLDRLVRNHRERVQLGIASRAFVGQYRTHATAAADRLACYRSLRTPGKFTGGADSLAGDWEKWLRLEGGMAQGRHLVLLPSAFENALRDGLYALEKGCRQDAARWFHMARSLYPDSYLPYLYLSACAETGGGEGLAWAAEALARNPDSLMARLVLQSGARSFDSIRPTNE